MHLLNALREKIRRSAAPGRFPSHAVRHRPPVLEPLEDRMLLSYSFHLLADDGTFSLQGTTPTMNDQGTVAFHAGLKSGGEGVFTRDTEGHLGIIAITSDLIRAFPIGSGINNAGTVSFGADLRVGGQAIFTGRGGPLSPIADTGAYTPFSSFLGPAATINNEETVAFRATLKSGATGIFTERAGEPPSLLYVTGGPFAALLYANIQRNGKEVVFRATLSTGGDGVFLGDGLTTTTIATTGDTYSAFTASVPNDAGNVVIMANLTAGGQAIVTGDGTGLTTIADTSGAYSSFFGNVAFNNDGQVVFTANLVAGGSGIFTVRDGVVDEIIATGDSLFGSTVTSFAATPFAPRGLNNAGQLGFAANLADGRTVIARADPGTVSLAPSQPAPQPVGERITWTATATNCGDAPVFQFSVGPSSGPFHVVRDFSPTNTFTWRPMQEGTYGVRVTVKESYQAVRTISALVSYGVDSRVTGPDAVVTPTLNPLVALYSIPPHSADTVHVEFSVAGDHPSWRSTHSLPSVPGQSTNFFVAGMLPNTTYQMRHVFSNGTASSPLLFMTGALSPTLTFPTLTVRQPPGPQSDLDQDLIYHVPVLGTTSGNRPYPFATDLQGRVVWYYDTQQSGLGINNMAIGTLVPGGTVLGSGIDGYSVPNQYGARPRNVLREIDLAGNPVRETNLAVVNAQLTALGHDVIYGFGIDFQRLPNGSTVMEGFTERTIDISGTPTNYVGIMILVLDQDFQVTWAWDAFDHLDVNRGPVLGEIVQPGTPVTSIVPNLPAVEWLHNNAVRYSPADGNLILSARMQDWVIKIDYRDGEGDSHVIWRLGKDGDFTVNSTDPNPWFSHQHDVHYIDDSTLVLFDNGNTRRASDPNAHSRGQVWKLDEQTMTATLVLNDDLGNSSDALGAAQRLSNGNFSFTSGFQGEPPNQFGQTIEVLPDGTKTYVLEVGNLEFRSYRMRTLYEGISDQLAAGGGGTARIGSQRGRYPATIDLKGSGVVAALMQEIRPVHFPRVDTDVLSNFRLSNGGPLAAFTNVVPYQGQVRERAVGPLAAPPLASSSRLRGALHDRVFADLASGWGTDTLGNDLPRGS